MSTRSSLNRMFTVTVLALTALLILTALPLSSTAAPRLKLEPPESLAALKGTEAIERGASLSTFSAPSVASVVESPATTTHVSAALRSSPVMFIENVGQFDDRARFQVRGGIKDALGGDDWAEEGWDSSRIIYVDHRAPNLVNDGRSWNTAYTNIQDALAAAAKGDEIWVAKGVYYPDIGLAQRKGDRKATFRLSDGVVLYGGFAGTEKRRDERDWVVNVTVLSGDIDTNDRTNSSGIVTDAASINGDNSYSVVTAQNVSKAARLDGFVITAGQATGKEFPLFRGGGMVVYDHSSPTIANVTFSGNNDVFGPNNGLYSSADSSPILINVDLGRPQFAPSTRDDLLNPYDELLVTLAPSDGYTGTIDYYGIPINVLGLLGQKLISETGRNKVGDNGIYHAPGVIVDRNSPPDRLYIYVVDSGNNRILGFNLPCPHGSTCDLDESVRPTIVFGQPNMSLASCNGDNNLGFTRSPSASTLCLLGYPFANNTAESWTRLNIDVDSQGNLYVPDFWNNRVLKFNQPLSADTTGGKGDAIADFVWGQDDMNHNGRNRGSNYGPVDRPDDHSLWISFGGPYFDSGSTRGVSVDNQGNVWIADTFNSRVLRFSAQSKNANLVLGQPDFSTSECIANGPLNRMYTPTLARIHPTTGDLYVLDEYPAPFMARILVFRPPFTNGMTAYRVITANQDGPFTNWEGWDGTGAYRFQSTGFVFNTYRDGEYASGEIWLNELSARRTLLIDFDGNIVKVIGAQNQYLRGGDVVYYPECGSIYDGNRLMDPGGSIGLDNANNIYLADEVFHTVYRYALPYNTYQVGNVECSPDANGVMFSKGPNTPSTDSLGESVGLAVWENQLIVRDEGLRTKVWDDYQIKPFGADSNYVLPGGFPGRNWLSGAIDDANRLWVAGEHHQVSIYQLPITSSGATPIADFVKLHWADTGLEVTLPDGVSYVQIEAMAFDHVHHAMYIVDSSATRIFRVSNYDQFATNLLVDMIIGQQNKTELRCNQGLSSPNAGTLCNVSQIKFDRQGNLFVVDNAYECSGNRRIVVFEAGDLASATGLFPNLQARKVFNAPSLNDVGNCAYWTVDQPGSPISVAFNSRNQMVVGNDGYYGNPSERQLKQLWFYTNPHMKQSPDASIEIHMGTPGDIAFDANDNLLIQDHTWYRVWMINLGCDPIWLSFLPGATIPDLPPCITPTPVQAGWNLIALPLVPPSSEPAVVFSSIAGQYDLVYAYDACDAADPWKKYDPNAPPFVNDLTSVGITQGLWVRAVTGTTLSVSGTVPGTTTIQLCAGWNLIGYPSQNPVPLPEALASIAGKYDLVYAYDAGDAADPWKKYDPTAPPFVNDLTQMRSGVGYWIRATEAATLVIN